jgi:hypothetical protein
MPDVRGLGTGDSMASSGAPSHGPVCHRSVAPFQCLSQGNQDIATPEPSPAETGTRSAGPETGGGAGRDFGTGRRLADPRPICDARLQTQGCGAADWPAFATGRRICDAQMQTRGQGQWNGRSLQLDVAYATCGCKWVVEWRVGRVLNAPSRRRPRHRSRTAR